MAKWRVGYFIYNIVLFVVALVAVPYLILRNLLWRRPILPYFLGPSKTEIAALQGKRVIWIQAVSLGESIVASSLIREIKQLMPDYQIVLTTTTPSGYNAARGKLGDLALVTYFPFEFFLLMKRFVSKIKPVLFVMVESELWPNAVRYSKKAGAKTALVNGRISDRSFKNYLRFSGFVKTVFNQIDLFAMQSVEDANRIGTIGAPLERIMVTGNIKFDQEFPSFTTEQKDSFRRQYISDPSQRIFTAASTHRGEEETVLEAYLNLVKDAPYFLILAPRHPDRANEVSQLLQQYNLPFIRRSTGEITKDCSVLLFDTFGELSLAYTMADVVFVGGSLIKSGGQNVLEAAAQTKPVIYGPHMDDFREAKRLLEEADAGFTIRDAAELTKTIQELSSDPVVYQRRAESAKKAVLMNRGAARNTADLIADMLGELPNV